MKIEFLGHAGFCIKTKSLEILVDPWLTPSSFERPILESFLPRHRTIDYLIPEPVRKNEDFSPDIILISHYHTHHSPKADIEYWLDKATKPITLIGFDIHSKFKDKVLSEFKQKYPQHTYLTIAQDSVFAFGTTQIRCLTYTQKFHLAHYIQEGSSSFLHIADAQINRFFHDRRLDPIWHKFSRLNPSLLALSVGTMSSREWDKENNSPYISENTFLSPVEAANLAKFINPKMAAVIGVFNFSIWKNRAEYGFPPMENEAYFRWALQHLNSEIEIPTLRPGMTFDFQDNQQCHISLKPI